MSDMADIIRDAVEYTPYWTDDPATHQDPYENAAAALSAAGFGPVQEARAEALERMAEAILTNDPLDYWSQHLPEGLGFQEAMSSWLKAHAKAERGWR